MNAISVDLQAVRPGDTVTLSMPVVGSDDARVSILGVLLVDDAAIAHAAGVTIGDKMRFVFQVTWQANAQPYGFRVYAFERTKGV